MTEVGGIASDRLRSLIERIERLEEEKKALSEDIRDIYIIYPRLSGKIYLFYLKSFFKLMFVNTWE